MIQQTDSLVFTQNSWKAKSTQKPHRDFYSSFIHKHQNLEANKMSVLQ